MILAAMTDDYRFSALQNRGGAIANRIELIGPNDLPILDSLERGVLFVMAFWSAPSFQMFSILMKALEHADSESRIRLLVADTDDIEHLYRQPPFNAVEMGGWGETFWIKQGEAVMTARYALSLKTVINQARLILDYDFGPVGSLD